MSESFAEMLRRERETAGLTQAELAERAGLGARTVSNLERGVNTSPYPSTVRLLADALELPEPGRGGLMAAARRGNDGEVRPAPTGGYLGARPATPLVARESERAAIVEALSAAEAGEGRTLLLRGEPGIGKTRLAQEASELAAQRGFLVATGRCYVPLSGVPFTPFFEVLATLHAAAPPSMRAEIRERWPQLMTLLPDDFPTEEPSTRAPDAAQRLHRAVAGFVRALAATRPVALVLDDLHWADGASLALLEHLARHTRTDHVLVVGTHRNVELGPTHPVRELSGSLRREGILEALDVERLDHNATARLLTHRLDDTAVTDEFSELIHRRAGGNPFFTVELLSALIERGEVSRIDGRWVRRDLSDLVAPDSVQSAINERVARLSPATQRVLEAASVLGEVFELDDLDIAELDEPSLEQALDEATAAGLLTADDAHYAFDHGLTQHALYSTLSPARRRRLHRVAGEDLERRPSLVRSRRAAEVARHLEAGGVPERAVAYVLLAGNTALGMHSHGEALGHYRHALALAEEVDDPVTAAEAHERLGLLLLSTAAYDESLLHLVRAADSHRDAGAHGPRLRIEGMIALAHHRRGAGEAAAARLAGVVAEFDGAVGRGDAAPGVASLHTGLARVRISLREHALAVTTAERAAERARAEGLDALESDALAVAGTALLFLDRPDDAVDTLERSLSLGEAPETDTIHSGAILALQWARTMRGEFDRARALGELGLEVTGRSGDTDAQALHSANLGLTLFYTGDWDQAQGHLERGVELARSSGPTLFSGIPPAYLGLLHRGRGDLDGAAACYAEAAAAPDLQTFAFDAYVDARLAELDVLRGDPGAALARLEEWLAAEIPSRLHDVMLLSTAAEACLALGDAERAQDLADRAARRALATRNVVDGIDAARIQGRCLALRGEHAAARSRLEAALARAVAVPHPVAEVRIHRELALLG